MRDVSITTPSGTIVSPSKFHFSTVTSMSSSLSPSQWETKIQRDNHELMKDIPILLSGDILNYLSVQLKSRDHLFEVIDVMEKEGNRLDLQAIITHISPVRDGRRFTDIRSYPLGDVLRYALDEVESVSHLHILYSTFPEQTSVSQKRRARKIKKTKKF